MMPQQKGYSTNEMFKQLSLLEEKLDRKKSSVGTQCLCPLFLYFTNGNI